MEVSFDEYAKIVSFFYRKAARIHPQKLLLMEKFNAMNEKFTKRDADKLRSPSSTRLLHLKSQGDDSRSLSNNSGKSRPKSYRSVKIV